MEVESIEMGIDQTDAGRCGSFAALKANWSPVVHSFYPSETFSIKAQTLIVTSCRLLDVSEYKSSQPDKLSS